MKRASVSLGTSSEKKASIGFFNLGCPKNQVDSEHMASVLLSAGFTLAPRPEEADAIIVNTCAFIGDAVEESVEAVFQACALKRHGRCRAVVMAGCLAQRYGRKLWETMPEVDAFVGLDRLDSVGTVLLRALRGSRKFDVPRNAKKTLNTPERKVLFTGSPIAYVKIAEGCDHKCGFCIIPAIRGRYRSRPMRDILAEAGDLLSRGIRELVLVSQDTTLYGRDLPGNRGLPGLLKELGRQGGKFWIRLLYGHPAHITRPILEAMSETPQVCKYLDLPVQHSHPAMLKAMRREDGKLCPVADMPRFLRAEIPDVTLRTTVLTGYPGEKEEHFQHLLEYVKTSRFNHLGVFTYSPQEGTRAIELPQTVPEAIAEERRRRLMLAQKTIVRDMGRKLLGREEEILIERKTAGSKSRWIGRSARHAPGVDGTVRVSGLPDSVNWAGAFVRVRYAAVNGYDMDAVSVRED